MIVDAVTTTVADRALRPLFSGAPGTAPCSYNPAPKQVKGAGSALLPAVVAIAPASAIAGAWSALNRWWYAAITVAATWSDTRLVPAITVDTPLRSRAATRPSGSLPGRSSVRPTSQLESTT